MAIEETTATPTSQAPPVPVGARDAAAHPVPLQATAESRLLALLPLGCALHCMLTPLLVAVAPALALEPAVEWKLLFASVALGGYALVRGARLHGHPGVWVLAVAGVALWGLALAGWLAPLPEPATAPLGGVTLAAGLFWNGRLVHQRACRSCGCPLH